MNTRDKRRYAAVVLVLVACSLWLRREALGGSFVADDLAQISMIEGSYPLHRSAFNLFTFADGTASEGRTLINSGFFPWFSDPELRLSMLRPLSSGMLRLDHAVFGRSSIWYHVHSALWWCALLVALALLYRRLMPAPTALLALSLFAVDEAHAVIVAWIANRCALAGVALAVIALTEYVAISRDEKEPKGRHRVMRMALLFALSFGFGEYGLCMLAYVVAYEWTCGAGPLARRARRLWPALLPAVLFILVRGLLHYTPRRSGMYVDPFVDPIEFAAALVTRAPVLAADMLLALSAEYWTFGSEPWIFLFVGRDWLPTNWFERVEAWRAVHVGVGLVACCAFAVLCRWIWKRTQNVHLRWLAMGSALSLVLVIGSFPSSRLLIVPLIGFCPLVAALFIEGLIRARALWLDGSRARPLGLAAVAAVVCVYHLVVPTWLTRGAMQGLEQSGRRTLHAVLNLNVDERLLPYQNIILLAAPEGDTSMYLPITRRLHHRPAPAGCYTLSLTPAPYTLTRVSERGFTIEFKKPAAMLRTAGELLLRSPNNPLKLNQVVDTGVFRVIVLSAEDDLPRRLLVHFRDALEDPSLRFMVTTREGIRTFSLPPVGRSVEVPAPAIPD